MTRTTRTPLALLLVAVLALAGALAAVTTAPAEAAPKPGPVAGVTVGDARIAGSKASVRIAWRKAPRARGYQVLWARSAKMKKARTASVRKRSYTVRNLAVGQTWCFQVRAVAGKKKGKRSAPVCRRIAKPGQSASPWIAAASVTGTGTAARTQLTVRWRATAGARSYELDYAITPEPVVNYPLWENKARQTKKVTGPTAVLPGLTPGKIYCFQVRAITAGGAGDRSPTHCKYTMTADRRLPAGSPQALDVATWNICASPVACRTHPFNKRVDAIATRIKAANVDVAAIQEVPPGPVDDLTRRLSGFDRACTSGAEAVFVRTYRYRVLSSSDTVGTPHTNPGACWARIEPANGGDPVVVVSLHLKPGPTAADDRIRRTQAADVLAWVRDRFPRDHLVLAGDTNSNRGHDLDGPRLAWQSGSLMDAYDIAGAFRSYPVQNSMNNWETTPKESTRWGAHIDRVFSSAGIHVASWEIIEPQSGGRYTQLLSDHSLVRTGLLIPTS
ncbi:fibronectin type III domain-containing protein [Pimelobacter simplex]|uniref:fibronectin type III domain-containing protein n=1 Tax=Nocardioides simplex TaxID=2045 RepID=UPI00381E10EF